MEKVAQQLLRAIRGRRSQRAWARILGYAGNPITDWENGRTYPTVSETFRAAQLGGVDVGAAFRTLDVNQPLDDRDVAHWLRRLQHGKSVAALARTLGTSRTSVSRWLSGKSQPRLPDFLRLVDAVTGRVHDLIAAMVPISAVPELEGRYTAAQTAKRLAFDAPWTEAILRVMETDAYRRLPRHDASWVSRTLRLSPELCAQNIELLVRAGLVTFDGGHYSLATALNVDTRGGREALRALKGHWARVAESRTHAPLAGDLLAYNVLSVSHDDFGRIHELLRSTFREIRAIVANSEPAERVALLNLHLIHWSPADGERDMGFFSATE